MTKLETAKRGKTSEEFFGLPKPPEHQCPNIDAVIKSIRFIEKATSKIDRLDEDDLRSNMDDISREVWGLESDLEDIRKAIEGVREWGEQWKELCKEIIEKSNYELDVAEEASA